MSRIDVDKWCLGHISGAIGNVAGVSESNLIHPVRVNRGVSGIQQCRLIQLRGAIAN